MTDCLDGSSLILRIMCEHYGNDMRVTIDRCVRSSGLLTAFKTAAKQLGGLTFSTVFGCLGMESFLINGCIHESRPWSMSR